MPLPLRMLHPVEWDSLLSIRWSVCGAQTAVAEQTLASVLLCGSGVSGLMESAQCRWMQFMANGWEDGARSITQPGCCL